MDGEDAIKEKKTSDSAPITRTIPSTTTPQNTTFTFRNVNHGKEEEDNFLVMSDGKEAAKDLDGAILK